MRNFTKDNIKKEYFIGPNPEFDELIGRLAYELYMFSSIHTTMNVAEIWMMIKKEKEFIKWVAPQIKRVIVKHAAGSIIYPAYRDYDVDEIMEKGVTLKDLYLARCNNLNLKAGSTPKSYEECLIYIDPYEGIEENAYYILFRGMNFALVDSGLNCLDNHGVCDIGGGYLWNEEIEKEYRSFVSKYEDEENVSYDLMDFEDLEAPYPWERYGI